MSRARSEDFKLEDVVLSFPALLKPRVKKSKKGTYLQYEASLLWPKSVTLMGRLANKELVRVDDLAVKTAVAEWGDKAIGMIKDGIIRSPFLDGDSKQGKNQQTGEPLPGYPGHRFIRCTANEDYPPKLIDKRMQVITGKDVLYPGCRVNAVVNFFAWINDEGGKGLSVGLSMVQFAKDGERLGGGGADPDKFFDAIADEGEAPEATKSGAGAGGLFA